MIRTILSLTLKAIILLLFTGCPYGGYKYDEGKFPSEPINFNDANSEYDDYNMASPVIENERFLYFSSNRNSSGDEFDIVGSHFHILWDKDKGRLTVDDNHSNWKNYDYIDSLFLLMNTGYNELGPLSLPSYSYISTDYSFTDLIVFSNDEGGNLDLKFVWFTGHGENPTADEGTCGGPEPVKFLNTTFNDAYLAFYGPDYFWNGHSLDPANITELVFCSDRDGNFDIYRAPVPSDTTLLDFLQKDSGVDLISVDILNSSSQDKCPYVDGQLLVFTSDRPGGFGGFDLYYSRRDGDNWSEPVNFGDKINTSYDEYRPIVARYDEFVNDLLMFSSNRPGGKGGFDLYYVGIPTMIWSY